MLWAQDVDVLLGVQQTSFFVPVFSWWHEEVFHKFLCWSSAASSSRLSQSSASLTKNHWSVFQASPSVSTFQSRIAGWNQLLLRRIESLDFYIFFSLWQAAHSFVFLIRKCLSVVAISSICIQGTWRHTHMIQVSPATTSETTYRLSPQVYWLSWIPSC